MKKNMVFIPMAAFALVCFAAMAAASDVVVPRAQIKYFIGTFNSGAGTFTDYSCEPWDETNPLAYNDRIKSLPSTSGAYYGLPPWYLNMANAILEVPGQGIAFVSLIDVRKENSVQAIITKWAISGDSLRLICVGGNFPGLEAAVNFDGCFLFPDSSRLLVARSGGGDIYRNWRSYLFILEIADCQWLKIYELESISMPYEPEFTESWCQMVQPETPDFMLNVFSKKYKQHGKNTDGSYRHGVVGNDSTMISLWDLAQKARAGEK